MTAERYFLWEAHPYEGIISLSLIDHGHKVVEHHTDTMDIDDLKRRMTESLRSTHDQDWGAK